MSTLADQRSEIEQPSRKGDPIWQWIGVALLVYLLIAAVGMIGSGFKSATGDQAKELFAFATKLFYGRDYGNGGYRIDSVFEYGHVHYCGVSGRGITGCHGSTDGQLKKRLRACKPECKIC